MVVLSKIQAQGLIPRFLVSQQQIKNIHLEIEIKAESVRFTLFKI
jgi:hypothetical protein